MKLGKLIGIGVGPGDPELLTRKAYDILKKIPIICSPRSAASRPSVALSIVRKILESRNDDYKILEPVFPMIEDQQLLESHWHEAALKVQEHLQKGQDVAFITLGDPTVYSTFAYLEREIRNKGYEVEIVPGVTSFTGCAAAAKLPLGIKDEIIVIVPKVDDRLSQILEHADTAVIMKTSRHSQDLQDIISSDQRQKKIISVQNCTMDDEKVLEGFSHDKKYFSTTIIKFTSKGD